MQFIWQWRGSATLHARLEGRLVAAHVLCSSSTPSRLAASCAAFRIAGATQNALLGESYIPFSIDQLIVCKINETNRLILMWILMWLIHRCTFNTLPRWRANYIGINVAEPGSQCSGGFSHWSVCAATDLRLCGWNYFLRPLQAETKTQRKGPGTKPFHYHVHW